MTDRWWVVMTLQEWSQIQVSLFPHVKVSDQVEEGFPQRWLAVFNDRAEAEAWADGHEIVEIQPLRSRP